MYSDDRHQHHGSRFGPTESHRFHPYEDGRPCYFDRPMGHADDNRRPRSPRDDAYARYDERVEGPPPYNPRPYHPADERRREEAGPARDPRIPPRPLPRDWQEECSPISPRCPMPPSFEELPPLDRPAPMRKAVPRPPPNTNHEFLKMQLMPSISSINEALGREMAQVKRLKNVITTTLTPIVKYRNSDEHKWGPSWMGCFEVQTKTNVAVVKDMVEGIRGSCVGVSDWIRGIPSFLMGQVYHPAFVRVKLHLTDIPIDLSQNVGVWAEFMYSTLDEFFKLMDPKCAEPGDYATRVTKLLVQCDGIITFLGKRIDLFNDLRCALHCADEDIVAELDRRFEARKPSSMPYNGPSPSAAASAIKRARSVARS